MIADRERGDGRQPDELRPIEFETDYIIYPEGSVLVAAGRTKVLCNASVESGVPGWMDRAGRRGGWVTGEYAMLPRATQERTRRETLRPRGRSQEIRRLIGRSLRAAVLLEQLEPVTITVDCDVLQADGGTRTASVTGGFVALALALMDQFGAESAVEVIRAPIAAVSVGVVDGRSLLDLNYEEDVAAQVDANVVLDGLGRFIEVQSTAEGEPIPRAALDELLDLAASGIAELISEQRRVLAEHGLNLDAAGTKSV